jgi:hypothetical protein
MSNPENFTGEVIYSSPASIDSEALIIKMA